MSHRARLCSVLALLPTTAFALGLPSVPQLPKAPTKPEAVAPAPAAAPASAPAHVPDDGVNSDVHRANVGKVVFATADTAFVSPEKTELFETEFAAGQGVYASAYLPMSMENALRDQGVRCVSEQKQVWMVSVDGEALAGPGGDTWAASFSAFTSATKLRTGISLTQSAAGTGTLANGIWALGKGRLGAGRHALHLELSASCKDATGAVQRLTQPLAVGDVSVEIAAAVAATGTLPPAAKNDTGLSGEMVGIMKAKWTTDEVRKVVITQKDWSVQLHKVTELPVSRTIGTAVAVRQHGTDCAWFDVSFIQTTTDGGVSWGPTQYNAVGTRHPMACEP